MNFGKIFNGDKVIWVVFFLLSIISLVAVYSSIGLVAYSLDDRQPTGMFMRHVLMVIICYGVVIGMSKINYRYISRFALLSYVVALVMLVVMLSLQERWMKIPIIKQFQPSEIAKVVLIICVARALALKKEHTDDLGTFIKALLYILPVVILVLPGNFSTAALIFLSSYLVMLFGGVKRSYWWQLLIMIVAVVGIAMFVMLKTGEHSETIERSETWRNRVDRWMHPQPEELSQENMAKMAIARGGLLGVGVGNTVHARLMTQAHNDFIYAIILEETGMVGGIVVFVLYSILYFRCIKLSWRCRGRFGALSVAGLGTMIYLQAVLNMGVAVGIFPVTGQTLPFISYGGTAYIMLGMALGVIQSVAADANRSVDTINEKSIGNEIEQTAEEVTQ